MVDNHAQVLDLAAVFPCRIADPDDLLLTEEEIETLRPDGTTLPLSESVPTAREIYHRTGGWLTAVQAMFDVPETARTARRTLIAPLARWLITRDRNGAMAETAFLPTLTDHVLGEFHAVRGGMPLTTEKLFSVGLLRTDETGAPFMPVLIRDALRESIKETDPHRAGLLVDAATKALEATGRVDQAVDTAVRGRAWSSLREVLVRRWADLFTSDARLLRAVVSRFPQFMRSQREDLNVILRILSAAGPDRMVLPLPSVEPDLERDRTAHRLRGRTQRMYRDPDALAVSYGLLEIGHLRLAGHYEESAESAVLLRRALASAMDARPVSLVLASLADLHAGMSLHLADRLPEAQLAYRSALERARASGHHFLEADALSKLSLVFVQQGQTRHARLGRVAKGFGDVDARVWGYVA